MRSILTEPAAYLGGHCLFGIQNVIWHPERLAKFGYFCTPHVFAMYSPEVAVDPAEGAVATVADALSHAYRAGVSVDLD